MSWPIVKLGEVCDLRNGYTPKADTLVNDKQFGSVPYFRVAAMNHARNAIWMDNPSAYCIAPKRLFPKGAVVFPKNGGAIYTGKVRILEEECIVDLNIAVASPHKEVMTEYLYYYVRMLPLDEYIVSGTLPFIDFHLLRSAPLPLPPLPEQKRIVEDLEWKLARLEKIEGNFRAMAETAAQASRSVLTGTFRSLDAPIVKLGEVCEVKGGGTPPISHPEHYGGGIPWATVRDMTSRFLEETERTITPLGVANSATNIIPSGNIVIATRVGLGKVCQLRQDTAINQDLRGFMPKSSAKLEPDYLYYWFRSMAPILEAMGTGATVKGVRINQVTSLLMPLPPLWDQKQIVEELEWKLSRLEKVERLAQEGLTVCEQARRAILAEAFRQADGADVRQDCSAAGQAEPSAQ